MTSCFRTCISNLKAHLLNPEKEVLEDVQNDETSKGKDGKDDKKGKISDFLARTEKIIKCKGRKGSIFDFLAKKKCKDS